jgi:hypothetical protein
MSPKKKRYGLRFDGRVWLFELKRGLAHMLDQFFKLLKESKAGKKAA